MLNLETLKEEMNIINAQKIQELKIQSEALETQTIEKLRQQNDTRIWKKITYPTVKKNMYIISEDGEILNMLTMHKMSPFLDKDGYLKVGLIRDDKRRSTIFVHRLVAFEFVENPNQYPVVDHINGIKTKNHYTNLEWVTVRENTIRAQNLGLRKIHGEYNGNSKYTETQVRDICQKFEDGWSIKKVLKYFTGDKHANTVKYPALYQFLIELKKKQTWQYIVDEYEYDSSTGDYSNWNDPIPESSNYIYSEDTIRDVCKKLESGMTILDIIEAYTGKRDTSDKLYDFINGIRTGKNWKHISSEYNIDPNKGLERNYGVDLEVIKMVDNGFSKKEIRHSYGIMTKASNPKAALALDRMVDRYKRMKELNNDAIIKVDNSLGV